MKVYVVIEINYEMGVMSWVFKDEEIAKKDMELRKQDRIEQLIDEGYTPVFSGNNNNFITCKEQKDNIFFDFYIDETEIFEGGIEL